jgi:hypothetical protein
MSTAEIVLVLLLICVVASLYSCVGHAGALIGSGLGSRRFEALTLRRVLAAVLVIASVKFILI